MISDWFSRAWNLRIDIGWVQREQDDFKNLWGTHEFTKSINLEDGYFFEAFSSLWYAFNAWAACVTDTDTDRAYIDALATNDAINEHFLRFTRTSGSPLAFYAGLFAKLWPIFEDRSLRRLGVIEPPSDTRKETVRYYFRRGMDKFEPQCWKNHQDANEPIPIDWFHTLHALYRVRCNLFHGEKTPKSEIDQQIIFSAFHTLLYFLRLTNYLELDNHSDEDISII